MNQKKADLLGFREFSNRFITSVVHPKFPVKPARLADELDEIRPDNSDDPRIKQLNSDNSRLVNEDSPKNWLDKLNNYNLNTGIGKLSSTVPFFRP